MLRNMKQSVQISWPEVTGELLEFEFFSYRFVIRFSDLKGMSSQLEQEKYWRAAEIKQREVSCFNYL